MAYYSFKCIYWLWALVPAHQKSPGQTQTTDYKRTDDRLHMLKISLVTCHCQDVKQVRAILTAGLWSVSTVNDQDRKTLHSARFQRHFERLPLLSF